MQICNQCHSEKLEDQYRSRIQRGKPYIEKVCKQCQNSNTAARAKERYANDPDFRAKIAAYQKKYFSTEKGREANRRGNQRYVSTEGGREVTRQANRRQRKERPAVDRFLSRTRHLSKRNRVPEWADIDAIRAVYAEAERLTKETGIVHHVDHIVPLHSPIVSGLHWHGNLRPLPAAENIAKGNLIWPDMPDDPQDVVRSFGISGSGKRVARAIDIARLYNQSF